MALAELLVDLSRIRANAAAIRQATRVQLLAVIKADAYGIGAREIVLALKEVVDGFCVFGLAEAVALGLWDVTHKPILALGPLQSRDARDYLANHVTPCVSTTDDAGLMRAANPALAVDVGMRRFGCKADDVMQAIDTGLITQVFAHATSLDQVEMFKKIVGERRGDLFCHLAGSSLLQHPEARMDAVRPGLALFQSAVTLSARLVEVNTGSSPAGYTRFNAASLGVILMGYSSGLRAGLCLVNGRPSRILEVGMQSAFVETISGDRVGDRVELLGPGLSAQQVAQQWNCSPQEALYSLTHAQAERVYCAAD